MKKIKNLTFSPLRIMVKNIEKRIDPREFIIVEELNEGIIKLVKKGLLKVQEYK